MSPGAASLLTRAQKAHWTWNEPIDVTHVYLSAALMAEVASEVMDCLVTEVCLADVLRTDDPVMTAAMAAIRHEAAQQAMGGPLYVETVARGLIIHLLRRYAAITRDRPVPSSGLSPAQCRIIREHIDANLAERLDLAGMAAQLGMTPCLFARRFRISFGLPAYAWVTARRLERARRLLGETGASIKAIAVDCGFADQAHLTRLFARETGVTPAAYRRALN
ncbi:helix-turn-helix domain-containing protein [Paracoccus limosus]|nr:AraC family transcriptional regulator [Paracoccus limosus]